MKGNLSHPAYLISEKGAELAESALGEKTLEKHPDFIRVQPEGATIKVESIHQLRKRVLYRPLEAKRLVILIEEAEKMTEAAANALLKTLEEPPPY
ncbi:MAG: hypothetical protein HY542_05980, partial [Deltaproteobacteria bacterium]|nr:hypothetical protein [Deltaproteobacteria bacterium]